MCFYCRRPCFAFWVHLCGIWEWSGCILQRGNAKTQETKKRSHRLKCSSSKTIIFFPSTVMWARSQISYWNDMLLQLSRFHLFEFNCFWKQSNHWTTSIPNSHSIFSPWLKSWWVASPKSQKVHFLSYLQWDLILQTVFPLSTLLDFSLYSRGLQHATRELLTAPFPIARQRN